MNKADAKHSNIPKEIIQKITETQLKDAAHKATYGEGRPIISSEFQGWRIVVVGNEIHYGKKEKTQYFPDFLGDYVRIKFGSEWGNNEIAKPLESRRQILKWYDSMCHYQATLKPEEDGTYKSTANGSMLSWYRLAYDLYLIKHNSILQETILNRLRNNQQF